MRACVRACVLIISAWIAPRTRKVARPNNETADIGVLEAGGFADVAAHDKFCAAGDCVIKLIYDQSPQGNHLGQRITCVPGQGCVTHKMVNASKHRIRVRGGGAVYGMWFDPGHGYHVDYTSGVAKGNDPESIYAVMSGTHFNGRCCFDCAPSQDLNYWAALRVMVPIRVR